MKISGERRKPATGLVLPLRRSPANGRDMARACDPLLRYWSEMRRGAAVPLRRDIDPRGIEALLPHAFIAERIASGHARFRIAGSHLSDLMGIEVRGMPLTALIAQESREAVAAAVKAHFDRPAIVRLRLAAPARFAQPALAGALMLLPLRSDAGAVTRTLGCLITDGAPGRAPRRFAVTGTQTEPVGAAPVTPKRVAPAPAQRRSRPAAGCGRPYLRLVT